MNNLFGAGHAASEPSRDEQVGGQPEKAEDRLQGTMDSASEHRFVSVKNGLSAGLPDEVVNRSKIPTIEMAVNVGCQRHVAMEFDRQDQNQTATGRQVFEQLAKQFQRLLDMFEHMTTENVLKMVFGDHGLAVEHLDASATTFVTCGRIDIESDGMIDCGDILAESAAIFENGPQGPWESPEIDPRGTTGFGLIKVFVL